MLTPVEELLHFVKAVREMRDAQRAARSPDGGVTRQALAHLESVVDGQVEFFDNAPLPLPPVPPLSPAEMVRPGE